LRMSPRRCCCFAVSRLFPGVCTTQQPPGKGPERACLRTALRSCQASVEPPSLTPTLLPRRACPNPAGQIPDTGTRQSLCSTRQAIFCLQSPIEVCNRSRLDGPIASAAPKTRAMRTASQQHCLRAPSDPRVATAGVSQGSIIATPDVASWHHFPATSPSLLSSPPAQVQVHRNYPINRQTLLQDLAYDGTAKSGGEDGSWISKATGCDVRLEPGFLSSLRPIHLPCLSCWVVTSCQNI
jgi:hypothetical protein